MLSQGRQLKETFAVGRGRRGRSLLAAALFGALIVPGGCAGLQSKSPDSANVNQSIMTANNSFITSINGDPFAIGKESYEGGYRVELEGTFPDPSVNAYIVVKPERQDYYQIQPRVVKNTRASWIGQAFLGKPESGIGESFVIFTVFTPDTYEEGDMLERAPEGTRSATIKYTRTRN